MNRNNIWVHIVLAVVLIGLAAVAGQISRWVNGGDKIDKYGTLDRNTKTISRPLTV